MPHHAVVIEDYVLIGARSIVLKGVQIGAGAVVGAGSVASRDVPPGSIVAGNPAVVVGSIVRATGNDGQAATTSR